MAEILDRDGVLNEIASKTKVGFSLVDGWVGKPCRKTIPGSRPSIFIKMVGFLLEDDNLLDLPPQSVTVVNEGL